MRTRTLILAGQIAALTVVAVAASLILGRTSSPAPDGSRTDPYSEGGAPIGWTDNQTRTPELDTSLQWRKESDYLIWDNSNRVPSDRIPNPDQHPSGPHPNPDRIRILALGDSFTWGHGTYDLDVRWPNELEEELNARTAPGTFEVVVASRPGTGPALWLDWFDDGLLDADDWDAIVLGIVWNDAVVTGHERSICADGDAPDSSCPDLFLEQTDVLERCLSGQDGIAGLLTRLVGRVHPETGSRIRDRRCDLESIRQRTGLTTMDEASLRPERTSYWDAYLQALARLEAQTRGPEVVAFHAVVGPHELAKTMPVRRAMEDAGFRYIEPNATLPLIEQGGVLGMFASRGVQHPGPAFTRLYAIDVADDLLPRIPPARLDAAAIAAASPTTPLVSNSLPAAMRVEQTPDRARIGHTPGGPGYQHDLNGDPLPEHRTPCAEIGRPHLRIMLRRDLEPGTALTIHNDSDRGIDLTVVGYDERRSPTMAPAGNITPAGSATITVGGIRSSGILVAASGSDGCPTDRPIDLPPISLRLETGQR